LIHHFPYKYGGAASGCGKKQEESGLHSPCPAFFPETLLSAVSSCGVLLLFFAPDSLLCTHRFRIFSLVYSGGEFQNSLPQPQSAPPE
jgi:hypothetical protein